MKILKKQVLSLILCVTLVFSFVMPCVFAEIGETVTGTEEYYGDDEVKKDNTGSDGTDIIVDSGSDVNGNKDTGNSGTENIETQKSKTKINPVQKANSSESDAVYGNLSDNADQTKFNAGNTDEAIRYGLYIAGEEITSENSSTVAWEYDATAYTLTLKGVAIDGGLFPSETGGAAAGIYFKEGNLIVNLTADTAINCDGVSEEYVHYGIYNAGSGTLTITGTGSLTVNSGNSSAEGISSYGIYSGDAVVIESGIFVNAKAGNGTNGSDGVYTSGTLTVYGKLSAEGSTGIEGNTIISGNAEVISKGARYAFSTAPTADGFSITLNDREATPADCTNPGTVKISKTVNVNGGSGLSGADGGNGNSNPEPPETAETRIITEPDYLELKCYDIKTISVSVYPEGKKYTCRSENPSVASVMPVEELTSENQITITACSVGDTVVTLTTEDGKTAEISVKVNSQKIPVEHIMVRNWPETMTKGDSKDLTVDIYPSDAFNLTYSVTSSDSSVISCPEGSRYEPFFTITAQKEGSSTITVSSADGAKTDEWTVAVLPESEYDITAMSGDGVWENGDFSVTCNGPAGKLNSVTIDREKVQTNNYNRTESGASVIVFSDEFMASLDAGTHYLELFYNNGRSKAVTVFSIPEKKVPPTAISVECPDTVEIGKSITAFVKVLPDNAYSKDYTITVNGKEYVNIEEGESSFSITGIKKGIAVFSIKNPKTNVEALPFYVNVVEESVPVDSINTVPESVIVEVGKESTVRVNISPDDATDKNFLCSTTNTDIIEIVEITGTTFKVKGKREGLAAIEVVSESDSQKHNIVTVNVVSASVLPENIVVTPESNTLSAGKSIDVSVVMTPETVTNKAYRVTVESDKPDVVYVESGELTGASFKVLGLGEGTATLTVSSVSNPSLDSPQFSISCDVKVEKIKTNKSGVFIGVGESETVSVSIEPSKASNKQIRAYSEDPDIAMLDSSATNGLRIVGVAPGETDIVLEAKDGSGVEKDIHITVSGNTTSIQLTDAAGNPVTTTSINQKYGTKLLVARLYPDTSSADVLWSSSNPLVAYVLPANGGSTNTAVVTGYGSGTAVITAEAGDAKASCTVNVSCGDNYYEITYKDNSGVWYYDYPSNYTVRCSCPEYAFYGLQIDGVYVDSYRYTVSSVQSAAYGISLTISSNYMKNLSTGRHLLTLYFNNGAKPVSTYIYVQSSKDNPKTGDSGIMPELVMMAASAGLLTAVLEYRRKKRLD